MRAAVLKLVSLPPYHHLWYFFPLTEKPNNLKPSARTQQLTLHVIRHLITTAGVSYPHQHTTKCNSRSSFSFGNQRDSKCITQLASQDFTIHSFSSKCIVSYLFQKTFSHEFLTAYSFWQFFHLHKKLNPQLKSYHVTCKLFYNSFLSFFQFPTLSSLSLLSLAPFLRSGGKNYSGLQNKCTYLWNLLYLAHNRGENTSY